MRVVTIGNYLVDGVIRRFVDRRSGIGHDEDKTFLGRVHYQWDAGESVVPEMNRPVSLRPQI